MRISENFAKAPPATRPNLRQVLQAHRERDSLGTTLALALLVFAVVFAGASLFA